ncbi:MAG: dolichol kinase [Natronomonas sp.]|uniref:dolichol kinase n=1 Tax=Natronomonas sp. TaxID=2184060 RepID=UPI002870A159|nr:dolichol kinase [Natronomonas sp.]MDR9380993.1 dolichol kinase [Natronomonas sp.]MDR9431169.1 dolichol kinase [Natronomonas sp.]
MAFEIGRRFVHASGAIVPGAYLLDRYVLETGVVTWGVVQTIAVAGLAVTTVLETARLRGGLEHAVYDRLTREYEQNSVAGYALYVVGATITVFAFEPTVAVPALLMLCLGDPISGMLSSGGLRTIARPRVLVGMFIACFLTAYPFVPLAAAVAGALGAMLADGIKPIVRGYVIDDNLTIPIVAASAMWAALIAV